MDRFTLMVVGGVVALVAAGIVAAVVVRGNGAPPDLSTPSGVVLAYALAEQHGDAQAAWDLLATSTQQRADHDRFVALAGSQGPGNIYLSTENERIDGTTASVVLVRTFANTGGIFGGGIFGGGSPSSRFTVQLVLDNGNWRISVPPDSFLLSLPQGRQP